MFSIGLGLKPDIFGSGSGGAGQALSGIMLSNNEVESSATAGTLIGFLFAVGGNEPITFAITSQEDNDVEIVNTDELRVATGADLSTVGATYDVTIEATDAGGATVSQAFSLDIEAVDNGSGLGDSDGEFVIDEGWEQNPGGQDSNDGFKISGKSGGLAKFIFDIGQAEQGATYTIRYSADWSNLTKQGRKAFVGFGFKEDDDDFHMVGLKGDGAASTTMHAFQVEGAAAFQGASGITQTDAGAASHGTKDGPNWLQIEIAEDGTTYTLRSSSDGETWTDEFTDEIPSPIASSTIAPTFGVAVFLTNDDKGPFTITVELWELVIENLAFLGYYNEPMSSGTNVHTFEITDLGESTANRLIAINIGITHSLAASRSVTSVVLDNFVDIAGDPVAGSVTMTEHTDVASTGVTRAMVAGAPPTGAVSCDCTITLSGNGHSAFGMVFAVHWLDGFSATPNHLREMATSDATYSESVSWPTNAVILAMYVGKGSVDTDITGLLANENNVIPTTSSDGRVSFGSEEKSTASSANIGWTSSSSVVGRGMIVSVWEPL